VEFTVRFLPSGEIARVPAGTTLLNAARQAGLPVASACGEHQLCALCGLEIVEGSENLPPEPDEEAHIKQLNRIDERLRLSCHLEVVSDMVVRADYW